MVINSHSFLETEKTAIVSVPKGRVYYRFIVDGKEQYDPDKDIELYDGKLTVNSR